MAGKKETPSKKARRLEAGRKKKQQFKERNPEKYKARLESQRKRDQKRRANEASEERSQRLASQRNLDQNRLANESEEQRTQRLESQRLRDQIRLASQTEEQRTHRLTQSAIYHQTARAGEDAVAKAASVRALREKYAAAKGQIENFHTAINVQADRICEVCRKTSYPNQVSKFIMPVIPPDYLPDELKGKLFLILCHTCKSHLSNANKKQHPAKAYWNKLDPGTIPDCIKNLTESEIALLQRIRAYIKVIQFSGRFGQQGCQGLATLFGKDIFKVTEKIDVLPRST